GGWVGSAGHPPGTQERRRVWAGGWVGSAGHPPGTRGRRRAWAGGWVGSAGHPPGTQERRRAWAGGWVGSGSVVVVVACSRGGARWGAGDRRLTVLGARAPDGNARDRWVCHGVMYTFTASCFCISSTAWASLARGSLCVMRPSTVTLPWLRRSKASRSSTGDDEYVVES